MNIQRSFLLLLLVISVRFRFTLSGLFDCLLTKQHFTGTRAVYFIKLFLHNAKFALRLDFTICRFLSTTCRILSGQLQILLLVMKKKISFKNMLNKKGSKTKPRGISAKMTHLLQFFRIYYIGNSVLMLESFQRNQTPLTQTVANYDSLFKKLQKDPLRLRQFNLLY